MTPSPPAHTHTHTHIHTHTHTHMHARACMPCSSFSTPSHQHDRAARVHIYGLPCVPANVLPAHIPTGFNTNWDPGSVSRRVENSPVLFDEEIGDVATFSYHQRCWDAWKHSYEHFKPSPELRLLVRGGVPIQLRRDVWSNAIANLTGSLRAFKEKGGQNYYDDITRRDPPRACTCTLPPVQTCIGVLLYLSENGLALSAKDIAPPPTHTHTHTHTHTSRRAGHHAHSGN
jgi:hypothetical protein